MNVTKFEALNSVQPHELMINNFGKRKKTLQSKNYYNLLKCYSTSHSVQVEVIFTGGVYLKSLKIFCHSRYLNTDFAISLSQDNL